ncbi:Trafficking protein particle complex subunit 5 [Amphibalanus amphitrite]|uniref:Trafficking protein particle complex subunit 5 n=1 Tax=Amphibalanus amphitrite TaxID=1232801 RepID=A0A6A4VPD8_AMPAM|nr:trafficking protein particle complex subunit 5-like [Amphibalanus amphitrite]XP_043203704.1 trafficking protein particle complex subunit 5-like [Amphibalanus amphitrite]XP_043203705.1 trafficking protein particle complex subunit 5-like [Amphibalanus amphitrite]XP_043203706.1 trafficking protein particle complex subunit 5-like [Amphibalanus amphitrite]XP_043203707.1 trafficking protein particle complex subunit 5-like [Amphibalanus amphitrite]XP_043203708.1 trafficking protein particle comple
MMSSKSKPSILDRPLSRGKSEVSLSLFALLFAEIVHYTHNRVQSVSELQNRLSEMGYQVGIRMLDLIVVRERNLKRETKILNILLFIKGTFWKTLFGKEADKLEHANDDQRMYYIIEKEPLVNTFISVPKDKGSLNCAAYVAGMIEAVLCGSNFPAKVTAHWHKGTTFMVRFESSVLARDAQVDTR